jgi:hypothetical protein
MFSVRACIPERSEGSAILPPRQTQKRRCWKALESKADHSAAQKQRGLRMTPPDIYSAACPVSQKLASSLRKAPA